MEVIHLRHCADHITGFAACFSASFCHRKRCQVSDYRDQVLIVSVIWNLTPVTWHRAVAAFCLLSAAFCLQVLARIIWIQPGEFAQQLFGSLVRNLRNPNLHFDELITAHPSPTAQ